MGSVRVFLEPNRTEPKNSETEPNRTERLFKKFEPNRTEPKNSLSKPNRTEPNEFSFKTDKKIPCYAGIWAKLSGYVPASKSTQTF